MIAKWTEYRVENPENGRYIVILTFSGSSKQRRKLLRERVRDMAKQGPLRVLKHTWAKGDARRDAVVEWSKEFPQSK